MSAVLELDGVSAGYGETEILHGIDLHVDRGEIVETTFDPTPLWKTDPPMATRPKFFPIISSHSLATMMTKKANGSVEGFIVEGPTAGGHNAPPRGKPTFNELGEPVYGDRDMADLEKIAAVGLPFWLAGGAGTPEALQNALAAGAEGVQVGTLFAYCEESGLYPEYRQQVIEELSQFLLGLFGSPYVIESVNHYH